MLCPFKEVKEARGNGKCPEYGQAEESIAHYGGEYEYANKKEGCPFWNQKCTKAEKESHCRTSYSDGWSAQL